MDVEETRCSFLTEKGNDLAAGPQVTLALHASELGIPCGIEAAVGRHHVAAQIPCSLKGNLAVQRQSRDAKCFRIKLQKLGVVVEPLLEMRNRPTGLSAVAMEATSELVVDSAEDQGVERIQDAR